MDEGGIAGIVLVAGKSERMADGRLKQLLPFGGRSMAATVVGNAEASQLKTVVVVTGRRGDEVEASLGVERSIVVHNPIYEQGNVTSLRRGLEEVPAAAAIVLLLGDMPGVTTEIIDASVAAWRQHQPWAAYAMYDDGRPNHPFVLSRSAIEEMRETRGSKVLWQLLVEAPPQPVAQIGFDHPAPVDVDTPEDYEAALRQLGFG